MIGTFQDLKPKKAFSAVWNRTLRPKTSVNPFGSVKTMRRGKKRSFSDVCWFIVDHIVQTMNFVLPSLPMFPPFFEICHAMLAMFSVCYIISFCPIFRVFLPHTHHRPDSAKHKQYTHKHTPHTTLRVFCARAQVLTPERW